MKIIPRSVHFRITAEDQIVPAFLSAFEQLSQNQQASFVKGQFLQDLKLAFTEGVANAVRHARELERHGKIDCSLRLNSQAVEIRIEDHGQGYQMDKVPLPRFKALGESGRGVFMMRQLMDSVEYKKGAKKNILILTRSLVGGDAQSRDLDLLYEISDAILQSSDPEAVCQIILDRAVEVFRVEKASLLLMDRSTGKLSLVASRGLNSKIKQKVQVRPGEGISGFVYQHAKPCLIEDMEKNPSGWKKKKKYKSRSFISAPMICSPMRLGQESIGVINMTDRVDGKPFTKRDLRLLTTIANQATAYMHICRLMKEARQAELLKRELDIARDIQQSYLPSLPPRIPGLDLAGWISTPQAVGGDYYDYLPVGDDDLFMVVADVSGHDVAAAMTMVNLRGCLKAFLNTIRDPGAVLTRLNASLYEDLTRNDQFVSMILVRVRLSERKLELASAGHPRPLRLRQGKATFLEDTKASGPVLGVARDELYLTQDCTLDRGDSLVFYTDGAFEMQNASRKRLGVDRFCQMVQAQSSSNASELARNIRLALDEYRGGAPLKDDVTLVALKLIG